ncbi:hypothetical protein MMYC01_201503 [Madurella mycetomatis]|uniref:Uncharacterized protein n=1 Tax=Madurella mycetomatis TaxID=100816 RepID=A0A175WEN3_9PEZI|nr:hypothetical protein MMYC01_201503 [Madurella mycetomatis]
MKLIILFTFLLGIAVALESAGLEERAGRQRAQIPRPKKFSGAATLRAANRPNDAPSEYETSIGQVARRHSKAAFKRVPPAFIDPSQLRRRESVDVLRKLRRQVLVSDFFECTNPSEVPSPEDCDVIVDQVLSSSDELIVTANACLVFSFRTCQGFFCSLCETLSTTTDFIGSQLDTVDALCVENGQAGAIVGEDPPQWDAGFTYAGAPLPTYDVC